MSEMEQEAQENLTKPAIIRQKPDRRKLRTLTITLIVLAVLATSGYAYYRYYVNSLDPFLAAQKTLEALATRNTAVMDILDSNSKTKVVSADFKLEKGLTGLEQDLKANSSFYWSGSKEAQAVWQTKLTKANQDFLDLGLYFNPQSFSLTSPQILGRTAYGVVLDSLEQDLEKSFFSPNSKSKYALDAETYQQLKAEVGKSNSSQAQLEQRDEILNQVWQKAYQESNFQVSVSKAEIESNGQAFQADLVATNLTNEEAIPFLFTLSSEMQNNAEFKQACTETYGLYPAEAEEFWTSYIADLDELVKKLEKKELVLEFSLESYLVNGYLVREDISGTVEQKSGTTEFNFLADFGADPTTSRQQNISIALTGDTDFKGELSREQQADSEEAYAVKYNWQVNSKDVGQLHFNWDKVSGAYTWQGAWQGEQLKAQGYLTAQKPELNLSIDSLNLAGESFKPKLKLVYSNETEIPAAPDFENILTISQADFDQLLQDIETSLAELFMEEVPEDEPAEQ